MVNEETMEAMCNKLYGHMPERLLKITGLLAFLVFAAEHGSDDGVESSFMSRADGILRALEDTIEGFEENLQDLLEAFETSSSPEGSEEDKRGEKLFERAMGGGE